MLGAALVDQELPVGLMETYSFTLAAAAAADT
jgi:hypothetical protein